MQQLYQKIYNDAEFHKLQAKRGRFYWYLTCILLTSYFGFILIIAFASDLFSRPIMQDSVITLGILVGPSIIVMSFVLTGIYVWRSNREFDESIQRLINDYDNV